MTKSESRDTEWYLIKTLFFFKKAFTLKCVCLLVNTYKCVQTSTEAERSLGAPEPELQL